MRRGALANRGWRWSTAGRVAAWLGSLAPLWTAAASPPPTAEPIPPELLLESVQAAYRRPCAEEVTVRVRGPQGERAADSFTLRLAPVENGAPVAALLELGPLRVLARQQQVTVINTASPGRYVTAAVAGCATPLALARLLPPVPTPQLAFACGDAHAPTPYTPAVVWTGATIDSSESPPVGVLTGAGPHASVVARINATSGRLQRFVAIVQGDDGPTTIELTVRPLPPTPVDSWLPDLTAWTRVSELRELSVPPRREPLAVGMLVPDLPLLKPDMTPWPGPQHAAVPGSLVILLFRWSPERDGGIPAEAWLARDAIEAARRTPRPADDRSSPPPVHAVAALAMDLSAYSPERMASARQAWSGQAGADDRLPASSGSHDLVDLLWASSPANSIDRFAPDATVVLVVLAPDRRLRGVIVVDRQVHDGPALARQLTALLDGSR